MIEVHARAYTVPTDEPESDGTLAWDSTTIVTAEVAGNGASGLGYTYTDAAAAALINDKLRVAVREVDVMQPPQAWLRMAAAIRNIGRPGIGMCALSAVDIALWDLKARVLGVSLVDVLPSFHHRVPVYGSGGFTSYSRERLQSQLGGWAEEGITAVKMKIGRDPAADPSRLDAARKAIGDGVALFVDANGAFQPRVAVEWAHRFRHEWDVTWFEEPVSSGDIEGLRFVRNHAPGGIAVAAGEYAYVLTDAENLLAAGAVDCLQADVTRCGGITGLLQIGGLAAGHHVDVSGHCAPAVSAPALCALATMRHMEYFHDHVRLEAMLFDGTPPLVDGSLVPDRTRPGHGLSLRTADAERYRVA